MPNMNPLRHGESGVRILWSSAYVVIREAISLRLKRLPHLPASGVIPQDRPTLVDFGRYILWTSIRGYHVDYIWSHKS